MGYKTAEGMHTLPVSVVDGDLIIHVTKNTEINLKSRDGFPKVNIPKSATYSMFLDNQALCLSKDYNVVLNTTGELWAYNRHNLFITRKTIEYPKIEVHPYLGEVTVDNVERTFAYLVRGNGVTFMDRDIILQVDGLEVGDLLAGNIKVSYNTRVRILRINGEVCNDEDYVCYEVGGASFNG